MTQNRPLPDNDPMSRTRHTGPPRTMLESLLHQSHQSIGDAARQLDMSPGHLRRLVRGDIAEIRPQTRRKLERAYGHPAQELLAPCTEPAFSSAPASSGVEVPSRHTRLAQLVGQLNLSYEEAAGQIGISVSRLTDLARYEPSTTPRNLRPATRRLLQGFFNCAVEELLQPAHGGPATNGSAADDQHGPSQGDPRRRGLVGAPQTAFTERVSDDPALVYSSEHYAQSSARDKSFEAYGRDPRDVSHEAPLRHAQPRQTELDIVNSVPDTEPVRRRVLLKLLAAMAAGTTVDRADLAQLVASSSLAEPQTTLAYHWQSVASEYGQTYLTNPRKQTMRDLTIDLATFELTHPFTAAGQARNVLNEAGARIAALIAMACTDLGYGPEARHSWRLARQLSDSSSATDAQLWVRGQEALLGIYSGRPLTLINQLTANSLASLTDPRSPGTADLLAAEAQTFALQGRGPEALATLKRLERAFDDLPESVTTDIDSVYSWPEHRLRHTESFVYSMVGSQRDASNAHDRALRLYPASRSVSRCQIEMHRSVALIRAGDMKSGIAHATTELEKLPPGRRGRFVLAVAGHITASVPEREAQRAEVRDFRSYLSSLGYPAE